MSFLRVRKIVVGFKVKSLKIQSSRFKIKKVKNQKKKEVLKLKVRNFESLKGSKEEKLTKTFPPPFVPGNAESFWYYQFYSLK